MHIAENIASLFINLLGNESVQLNPLEEQQRKHLVDAFWHSSPQWSVEYPIKFLMVHKNRVPFIDE